MADPKTEENKEIPPFSHNEEKEETDEVNETRDKFNDDGNDIAGDENGGY